MRHMFCDNTVPAGNILNVNLYFYFHFSAPSNDSDSVVKVIYYTVGVANANSERV